MRLLITTDTVGGVWTYTRALTEGLLVRGHQVLLVSLARMPSVDQQAWVRRTCLRWSSSFEYLPTPHKLEWMQRNELCYRGAEDELMALIERFRPDILHLNQFCFGALPVDAPKLVVAHSDVMSWSQCCRGALPVDSAWYRQYLSVVRRGLLGAQAVAAPTRWMLHALRSNYCLPARTAVIPNGLSLSSRTRVGRRKLQAVTIGRVWDEAKNIRLLESVSSPIPVLIGGELTLEMEQAFASSRLRMLGPLAEQEKLDLLHSSSIYIAASRYEPFGLAPLEAALCGCAIVANDIASLREVWGETALYFCDAAGLSQRLHALDADAALLARHARQAYARARALYSQDAMVAKYLELYAALADAARAGSSLRDAEPRGGACLAS